MPFYPKSSFFNRYDSNILAARRVHCLELLEFAAKNQQLYNSQVFLNFFATVSSPTSLNSDEEIGQLMDKGQIMVSKLDNIRLFVLMQNKPYFKIYSLYPHYLDFNLKVVLCSCLIYSFLQ